MRTIFSTRIMTEQARKEQRAKPLSSDPQKKAVKMLAAGNDYARSVADALGCSNM